MACSDLLQPYGDGFWMAITGVRVGYAIFITDLSSQLTTDLYAEMPCKGR